MSGPSRLFMTTDALGGVWTYGRDLSAGLAARGTRVTLAVLGPAPSDAQRAEIAALEGVTLVETDCPLDWLGASSGELDRGGSELARLAREAGADLVHLNSPAFANADFVAPVVGVAHSCLLSWWDAMRKGRPPKTFVEAGERLRRGYHACNVVIAPTQAFADVTERLYDVRPRVVLNGRARPSGASAGVKWPVVVTSGRLWDQAKNVEALDAAARMMTGRIVAAGPLDGPAGERVRLPAVQALGTLDPSDLRVRLDAAAVYASLALYEPFGLGVLEAAQSACALVLSDIPTHRELWDGAALFVDPEKPGHVSRTLDGLLGDAHERGRLAALASARSASYSAAAMVERTAALYRETLVRPAVGGAAA